MRCHARKLCAGCVGSNAKSSSGRTGGAGQISKSEFEGEVEAGLVAAVVVVRFRFANTEALGSGLGLGLGFGRVEDENEGKDASTAARWRAVGPLQPTSAACGEGVVMRVVWVQRAPPSVRWGGIVDFRNADSSLPTGRQAGII
jgi:hypothetical protein